jgi:hypothetical protein
VHELDVNDLESRAQVLGFNVLELGSLVRG